MKHKREAHDKVEQVFDLFANCDADGNGKVDLAEFLAGVSFWKQQSGFEPQSKLLLYFQLMFMVPLSVIYIILSLTGTISFIYLIYVLCSTMATPAFV